jgi:hypothetical protein
MQHYWGQAVQYLERSVAVAPGKKLMLMAKRDGPRVRFYLRVRLELPTSPPRFRAAITASTVSSTPLDRNVEPLQGRQLFITTLLNVPQP